MSTYIALVSEDAKKPLPLPHVIEIIVNARPHKVDDAVVTFEEVITLAFPHHPHEPNLVYSVTYRHAASQPHAGELAAGGSVKAKTGTVFNVTKTIKS